MADIFSFELPFERRSTAVNIALNEEYDANVYFASNIFAEGWTLTIRGKLEELLVKSDVYLFDSSYSLCCSKINRSHKEAREISLRMIPSSSIFGRCTLIFVIYIIRHKKLSNVLGNLTQVSNKSTSPTKKLFTVKKLDGLSEAMKRLLEIDEDHHDVILRVNSKDFRAHKSILSARSNVFETMFQQPMKENLEGRVDIPDISPEIMKEMLLFIYTGVVTLKSMSMARDLFVAAHKYQIVDLQAACSSYMKNITLDSVVETLLIANLYEEKTLKKAVFNFVSRNFSLVKYLPSWVQFTKQHQNLAIEVLNHVIDVRD